MNAPLVSHLRHLISGQPVEPWWMVPVARPWSAPMLPHEAAERWQRWGRVTLLESARSHPVTGRFSILAIDPVFHFTARGHRLGLHLDGWSHQWEGHPLPVLSRLLAGFHSWPVADIPFPGGAIGVCGYDLARQIETLPSVAASDHDVPDLALDWYDTVIVWDHLAGTASVITHLWPDDELVGAWRSTQRRLDQVIERLSAPDGALDDGLLSASEPAGVPEAEAGAGAGQGAVSWTSTHTREQFTAMVQRAKRHITAGDIFQANLSQRLRADVSLDPWQLYTVLREVNPSPFAGFYQGDGYTLVCGSPERLVRHHDSWVDTRPIAGTRPRGASREHDTALSQELLLNAKERAEHIMLVDLERNDLGRVCEYGTVQVTELMAIEDYSHVKHIVSNITGRLRDQHDRVDILRAVFPGGTITGTPKIRCMELIDELEPLRRGLYTGSLGYWSWSGELDLNIIIRSVVVHSAGADVQVGAGIVADSDPGREYDETLQKAEAMVRSVEQAVRAVAVVKESV